MPLEPSGIAAAFGLGRPLGGPRPLANGDHPSGTRVLTTERGRWTVKTGRLLGDWHREEMRRTHRLESAALAAGVPMPRPVEPPRPAAGYWHVPAGGEAVRVTEWVEGHDLRRYGPADASLAEAAGWTGRTLGRIALLGLEDADGRDGGRPPHPVDEWREWVAEAEAGGHAVAAPARSLLPVVEEATALVLEALRERPRAVLVHGDVSRANVLRTPAGFALIDWDSAGAEVPWWDAVGVAFRFATPFNGPAAEGDPRVVRPLVEGYLDRGGPAGPADASAFAGMLRGQLASTAWCLWLALGHRRADAARRAFGLDLVTAAARELPRVLRSLDRWAALLR
ncbi:phosphotransferase enzyme family protein [Streptomyces sp. DH37]|uniref:phosphotransferase enzyme family protein n=1 Tax=Streptomyces sp. DH37 TaxID=3040122 RepID=UPI002441042A|nr:aminoglycoside phosphotransferase family protein [Streptomyces sp. DH37]MDG9704657.1 aminoglycoside phosphotransferase family protein [Streptomyces sp. DH37]